MLLFFTCPPFHHLSQYIRLFVFFFALLLIASTAVESRIFRFNAIGCIEWSCSIVLFLPILKGDVNRTLEELAAQVNGLIRQAVRYRLASSVNNPTVVTLVESWEVYKKLSLDSQQIVRTTVEEAQHLERRGQLLAKVLDLLDDNAQLTDVAEQIKTKLQKVVQQSNRVAGISTSGGCFEWVDSLLVKALRHGHWLLVDNVNLCSSSVLD